jgi:hypothetical protein
MNKDEKQIPNCAICEWCNQGTFVSVIIGVFSCNAQAGAYATDVYNNEICKELFKEKQSENQEEKS